MSEEVKRNKIFTPAERLEIANKIFELTELVFKWGKIQKSMTMIEACEKVGISYKTFANWYKIDKMIADLAEVHKNNRMAHMRHQAKWTVEKALYWEMKLKDKERVDIALRFLEKTDEDFKDRKEVTVSWLDFGTSMEDLEEKAKLLIKDITS